MFESEDLTLKQINEIIKKLGGKKWAECLLRGELVVTVPPPPNVDAWNTVKLGTGLKTVEDFFQALLDSGWDIHESAQGTLRQPAFTASDTETKVDVVVQTLGELGFQDKATLLQIYARALGLGFKLCPAEVGPQLCLQYRDQLEGKYLYIAMEPITDFHGHPNILKISVDGGGRWLYASNVHPYPNGSWRARDFFVFVRPRE